MNNIRNEKGMTLIELMISIMVTSIIITMLLSILTMSLKAKATMDVENKLLTQPYLLLDQQGRYQLFRLVYQIYLKGPLITHHIFPV